ncbi:UNVERIFIED_CONTAM: hypothetical protein Sradi_6526400 [Sesamum radiatum]|uniref:Uncharacterized protein n=1 Tax=Sesamum radiatum TaxID=300843 RepID=A0AAW2JVQ9_SESRA
MTIGAPLPRGRGRRGKGRGRGRDCSPPTLPELSQRIQPPLHQMLCPSRPPPRFLLTSGQ